MEDKNPYPFVDAEPAVRYPFGSTYPMVPPYWINQYPPAYPGSYPPPYGINYYGASGKIVDDMEKRKTVEKDSEEDKIKTEDDVEMIKLINEPEEAECKEEEIF